MVGACARLDASYRQNWTRFYGFAARLAEGRRRRYRIIKCLVCQTSARSARGHYARVEGIWWWWWWWALIAVSLQSRAADKVFCPWKRLARRVARCCWKLERGRSMDDTGREREREKERNAEKVRWTKLAKLFITSGGNCSRMFSHIVRSMRASFRDSVLTTERGNRRKFSTEVYFLFLQFLRFWNVSCSLSYSITLLYCIQ